MAQHYRHNPAITVNCFLFTIQKRLVFTYMVQTNIEIF